MGRRSTPEPVYEAERAGRLCRLTMGHQMSHERAKELVAAWEREAAQRGFQRDSAAFRQGGRTGWRIADST